MDAGVLAVLLIFGTPFMAVTGGIALKGLRILKEGPSRQNQQLQAEETKLIQELYQGLSRIEGRVEALETILFDQGRKEGKVTSGTSL
jgi:TolA-binding protein